MAISTNNGKLAVIEWDTLWEPAIPMVSTSFPTKAHKQQLLWGMPDPLWTATGGGGTVTYLPLMGVG